MWPAHRTSSKPWIHKFCTAFILRIGLSKRILQDVRKLRSDPQKVQDVLLNVKEWLGKKSTRPALQLFFHAHFPLTKSWRKFGQNLANIDIGRPLRFILNPELPILSFCQTNFKFFSTKWSNIITTTNSVIVIVKICWWWHIQKVAFAQRWVRRWMGGWVI